MKRLKIYYQFSDVEVLEKTRGDRINEFCFVIALSEFHDVFYNGKKVSSADSSLGRETGGIEVPKEEYDLYIVRSNHSHFLKLPGPKFTMAYPYDERVFAEATGLFVTTHKWAELLTLSCEKGDTAEILTQFYPSKIDRLPPMVHIGQVPTPDMQPIDRFHPQVAKYRMAFSRPEFCIGYFGRIDELESLNSLDQLLLSDLLKEDEVAVICTSYPYRLKFNGPGLIYPAPVPASEIQYALNATDILLAGEDPANEFLGSRKILEAIGCGVPILTKPFSARIEQLGEDYPLFYTTVDELRELITRFRTDQLFRDSVEESVVQLKKKMSFEDAAEELATKISELAA